MPEMHFTIEWPNGREEQCYSPSSIIENYLESGQEYPVQDFLERAGTALALASERVRQRYGFACSSALEQLRELERAGARLTDSERAGTVRVLALQKHAARDARQTPTEAKR
jgi:uncharacterized repeat protein (TIGR04042 family)